MAMHRMYNQGTVLVVTEVAGATRPKPVMACMQHTSLSGLGKQGRRAIEAPYKVCDCSHPVCGLFW